MISPGSTPPVQGQGSHRNVQCSLVSSPTARSYNGSCDDVDESAFCWDGTPPRAYWAPVTGTPQTQPQTLSATSVASSSATGGGRGEGGTEARDTIHHPRHHNTDSSCMSSRHSLGYQTPPPSGPAVSTAPAACTAADGPTTAVMAPQSRTEDRLAFDFRTRCAAAAVIDAEARALAAIRQTLLQEHDPTTVRGETQTLTNSGGDDAESKSPLHGVNVVSFPHVVELILTRTGRSPLRLATTAITRQENNDNKLPLPLQRERTLTSDVRGNQRSGAERSMLAHGKLVITGIGKSGHVGQKLAATFASTGTPALFLHAAESSHGDMGVICPETDVVLAISYSGETPELLPVVRFCVQSQVPLIALTGKPRSALASVATHVLLGPVEREACPLNLAPTSSTTVALALGDALAMAVAAERGFTNRDFARLHPSGSLGALLAPVRRCTRFISLPHLSTVAVQAQDQQCPLPPVPVVPNTADAMTMLLAMSDAGAAGVVAVIHSHLPHANEGSSFTQTSEEERAQLVGLLFKDDVLRYARGLQAADAKGPVEGHTLEGAVEGSDAVQALAVPIAHFRTVSEEDTAEHLLRCLPQAFSSTSTESRRHQTSLVVVRRGVVGPSSTFRVGVLDEDPPLVASIIGIALISDLRKPPL